MTPSRLVFDESMFSTMQFKEAARAWHAVYDGLDEQRAYVINQMCSIFEVSACAYRAACLYQRAVSKGKSDDSAMSHLCEAGATAMQCLIHFEILKDLFKIGYDELCKKIDLTSDWLQERKWEHLPEPVDENGAKHVKTAAGVLSDMRAYADAYTKALKFLKQAEEERKGVA